MKNTQNNQLLATLALVLAGIIGGLAALGSKVALRELPPLTVLFLRITIMVVILVPLSGKAIVHLKDHARQVGILGLFWVGNLILYILGIKYTTAIAAGVIYNMVPFFVLVEDALINHARLNLLQLMGIVVGFTGSLFIVFGSISGNMGLGTIHGNMLLFLAIISYSFYLVYSKYVSLHVTPFGLITGNAVVGWVVAGGAMFLVEGGSGLRHLPEISIVGWIAILYLGLLLGVLMYLLIQFGIKHGSALVAASMGYIGTLVTGITGILYLQETVSAGLLFGGILILIGVYLTSILPLLEKRKVGRAQSMV